MKCRCPEVRNVKSQFHLSIHDCTWLLFINATCTSPFECFILFNFIDKYLGFYFQKCHLCLCQTVLKYGKESQADFRKSTIEENNRGKLS